MSIVVTFEMPVRADMRDAFMTAMAAALVETRAYEGNLGVETCAEPGTNAVMLLERWESHAHQQAYMAWRAETGMLDVLASFLEGEVTMRVWDLLPDV
jgi:quinol monooxygenase YgiN